MRGPYRSSPLPVAAIARRGPRETRDRPGTGRRLGWVRCHSSRVGQPAGLACLEHACACGHGGGRSESPSGMMQHVLAERGQLLTAQRAAIGRGLAVLGRGGRTTSAALRPLGHRSRAWHRGGHPPVSSPPRWSNATSGSSSRPTATGSPAMLRAARRRLPQPADRLPQCLRARVPGADRRRGHAASTARRVSRSAGRSSRSRCSHIVLAMPRRRPAAGLSRRPLARSVRDVTRSPTAQRAMVSCSLWPATRADDSKGLSRSEVLRASPRMFDSDLLDKLSRVHPAVPPILFVPVITVLLVEGFVHGAGALTPLWLLGGYLFWTLTEYWLHRIVFHFEPEDGIGARLHWIIHGVHHDHPNDPMRLVMPPSVSVPLAALFVYGFYAGARQPGVPALRRRLPGRLPGLRHAALPRAPSPAQDARSAVGCASCTCAITSRTTSAATASAPRSGITCSAPRPARRPNPLFTHR